MKSDKTKLTPRAAEREAQIEEIILKYQAQNGGQIPHCKVVCDQIRGSYRDKGPAYKAVVDRITARQARADAQPEIPDALENKAAEFTREIWLAACELADAAASEQRNARAADLATWDQERQEMYDVIEGIEHERDAAVKQAEVASKTAIEALEKLDAANTALAAAEARLAERDAIMDLLNSRAEAVSKGESIGLTEGSSDAIDANFATGDLPFEKTH